MERGHLRPVDEPEEVSAYREHGLSRSSEQPHAVGRPEACGRSSFFTAPRVIWFATLLLLVFGLVMVFSASSVVSMFQDGGDRFFFLRSQAEAAAVGLVAMLVLSRLDYRKWRMPGLVVLAGSLVLLVLVQVPGFGRTAGGAARWIELGPVSLQPSEMAKLAVVVVGAHLLSTRRALKGGFSRLMWPFGLVVAAVCGVILIQPDLGTAISVGVIFFGLLWVAGMRVSQWSALLAGGGILGFAAIWFSEYRRVRLLAFLDPFQDPQDAGYQVIQSLIAVAGGGFFGLGPGRSVQKFFYLPEAHTDMIFAVVAEEFGFLGMSFIMGLFVALVLASWRIARRCRDPFGRYLVAGALLLIGGQAILNIGGVLGTLPLTGIPLPLVSFGRTNLVIILAAIGAILSVARHTRRLEAETNTYGRKQGADVANRNRRGRHGGSRDTRARRR